MKKRFFEAGFLAGMGLALALLAAGCGDSGSGDPSSPQTPAVTGVSITPSPAFADKGGAALQFSAEVAGTNSPAQTVVWSIDETGTPFEEGTGISEDGLLTAALDETNASLTVRAVSTVDSSKAGTVTVTLRTVASIAVTRQPTKTNYAFGVDTALDPAGIVVTATYDDTTTDTVTITGENLDAVDFTTAGTNKPVTVTYAGQTTSFNINLRAVDHIAIFTQPAKTNYALGIDTDFDPAGMVLRAYPTAASSGYWAVAAADYDLSYTFPAEPGSAIVTISYAGQTVTLTITAYTTAFPGIIQAKAGQGTAIAPVEIVLDTDHETPPIEIPPNTHITLKSASAVTVQLGSSGSLFTLSYPSSSLTLEGGVTLRGRTQAANGANNTAAVIKITNGTFTMKGGTITGNTSLSQAGGVDVSGGDGVFIMEGGTITGNSSGGGMEGAGGVYTTGTIFLRGGSITGNTARKAKSVHAAYSAGATGLVTLSGNPDLEDITLQRDETTRLYGKIAMAGTLTSSTITINLCRVGSPYELAGIQAAWTGSDVRQILNKAEGYEGDLQVDKFTLGKWVLNLLGGSVFTITDKSINAQGQLTP
jgi:hypothetical protein